MEYVFKSVDIRQRSSADQVDLVISELMDIFSITCRAHHDLVEAVNSQLLCLTTLLSLSQSTASLWSRLGFSFTQMRPSHQCVLSDLDLWTSLLIFFCRSRAVAGNSDSLWILLLSPGCLLALQSSPRLYYIALSHPPTIPQPLSFLELFSQHQVRLLPPSLLPNCLLALVQSLSLSPSPIQPQFLPSSFSFDLYSCLSSLPFSLSNGLHVVRLLHYFLSRDNESSSNHSCGDVTDVAIHWTLSWTSLCLPLCPTTSAPYAHTNPEVLSQVLIPLYRDRIRHQLRIDLCSCCTAIVSSFCEWYQFLESML